MASSWIRRALLLLLTAGTLLTAYGRSAPLADGPSALKGDSFRDPVVSYTTGDVTISPGTIRRGYPELTARLSPSSALNCRILSVTVRNTGPAVFTPGRNDRLSILLQAQPDTSAYFGGTHAIAFSGNSAIQVGDDPNQSALASWHQARPEWTGLYDRYFAMVLMPSKGGKPAGSLTFRSGLFLPSSEKKLIGYRLDHDLPPLAPGDSFEAEWLVYSGPKTVEDLGSAPMDLRPVLFQGLWNWMRWLCFGLLRLMLILHTVIPGWGFTLIALALVVRILLFPLSRWALVSQKRFNVAQGLMKPELDEIKRNFKGADQSERILLLYKKHNVSPFSGFKPLLPVLVQLPVLIALFQVLGTAFELRDAGFLWINTLAEPDRLFSFGISIPLLGSWFNLLPFLMAGVSFLSLGLSPGQNHKLFSTQNLFMAGITLMFFFLFYSFPSGLVLYWTFANLFQVIQQWISS